MEQTIVLKLRDGEPLKVSKQRLTADSRMFRYLIDELKYDELEMDDFSPEAVYFFLAILDDKKLGEIENVMFRELHKLAAVFEVEWLKKDCRSWLRRKMTSATENQEKTFLFDECWYIFKKWTERDTIDALISCLAPEDNSSFLSDYMSDINKLETEQIDLLLKLGGSNTDLFLRTILQNLVGQSELSEKIKHLLRHMNLAFCCEQNQELYLHVFDEISNLSEISVADMRFTHQLIADTVRLVSSRALRKKGIIKTKTVLDDKHHWDLVKSCHSLKDITEAVSKDRVRSMFVVVDILLYVYYYENTPNREDTQIFVTSLENISSNEIKKLQKISQQHLDNIIAALNYSNLEQSDQLLTLLNEIKINEKLSTYHENVIIKYDNEIELVTTSKRLYPFKHPGAGTCTKPGTCGFIVKITEPDGSWLSELCTNLDEYTGTGIHYHDIISTLEMSGYSIWISISASGDMITVIGCSTWWNWWRKWLPLITYWKQQQGGIAYNVTDYVVAKQH